MTVPPASSPRSSFLLGLDSSAPTAPTPAPRPPVTTTHLPLAFARLHRHTTQHTSRALVARVGSSFPLVSVPSILPTPYLHLLALLDKADFPLSHTLHLLRLCSLGGGDIADWAPGLGGPFPTLTSGFPLGGLGGLPWP